LEFINNLKLTPEQELKYLDIVMKNNPNIETADDFYYEIVEQAGSNDDERIKALELLGAVPSSSLIDETLNTFLKMMHFIREDKLKHIIKNRIYIAIEQKNKKDLISILEYMAVDEIGMELYGDDNKEYYLVQYILYEYLYKHLKQDSISKDPYK